MRRRLPHLNLLTRIFGSARALSKDLLASACRSFSIFGICGRLCLAQTKEGSMSDKRVASKLAPVGSFSGVGFAGECWQHGDGEALYFGTCSACDLCWGSVEEEPVKCTCGATVDVQAKET